MEVGNWAEWVAAAGSIVTAVIAGMALYSWRDQMRGTSRHAAAAEIAEAAQLIRYHFYGARNAFIDISEFPRGYSSQTNPSNSAKADAYAHVFNNRYSLLGEQIVRLATLRAKAGALLSEESAAALEELARKGRELHNFYQERVEQLRVGPGTVSQWPDQNWVKRVKESVEVYPEHTDAYSLEFEAKFDALRKLIEPFI
jgi:hypothetical protein